MDYNSHNAGFPQSHSSLFHVFLLCFLCSSALALVALLTQCDNPYPPPATFSVAVGHKGAGDYLTSLAV